MGKGWETKVEYRGLLYVLPRWTSRDFFALPEEDIEHLFEICDLYLTESPVDKGVLLVSRKPIRAVLHEVIGKLRDDGVMFSEPR